MTIISLKSLKTFNCELLSLKFMKYNNGQKTLNSFPYQSVVIFKSSSHNS